MKKTLLLVDGSSYLYRAYYALPNLRNAQGEPTGALYGVINMLRKLEREYKPDYLACIFDAKGKTFRDDLYPEYKANRSAMPEELVQQIAPIYQAVRAMGWPIISIEGVEADDVMGTLSKQAQAQGLATLISTGDKDMAQLVTDNIHLVDTMKGEYLDIEGVKNRYGVMPDQIIDYLMLIGDTSDNVPGVPKVGPKTAVKWLDAYGSLDNIIEHADQIKGVVGQNLKEAIPQFDLTRQLITIKQDCDVSQEIHSLQDLQRFETDTLSLKEIYDRYGFKTWLRELTGDATAVPKNDGRLKKATIPEPPKVTDYQTIHDMNALEACLHELQASPLVAVDTETTSLNAMQARLVGMSFSTQAGKAWYLPLTHEVDLANPVQQVDKEQALTLLKPWLEDDQASKVLHNAKYDIHVLANEGIQLKGVLHDTMLMSYVLASNQRVSLEDVAMRYLGRTGVSYESLCGKGVNAITFDKVPIPKASYYACEDADFTFQVHQVMWPLIQSQQGFADTYALEMQVMPVLVIMERNGVKIDEVALHEQSQAFAKRLQELEDEAFALVGSPFNLNSTKQLGEILFTQMGLPVLRKTPKGAPSTDEEVLNQLALDYPLPKLILEHRSLAKLKSTYTDKLPKMILPSTGRVHTHYSQASVVTGRLASSDPNLQNIPVRTEEGKRIREAFVAPKGYCIMSADYSQIELRVMAHLSGDENLLKAFAENKDIHQATASEIFSVPLDEVTADQRRSAKAINFGLIYGMGVFGLASNLGITREAAQLYIDRYFSRYPKVAYYMTSIREQAAEQGYVETVFGRRLWFPDIHGAKGPRKAAAERAAINAPMQGTAADLIKKAMVNVQRFLEEGHYQSRLILQVHDELVVEVPEQEEAIMQEKIPELMQNVAQLKVPLLAQLGKGKNWRQAH